MEIRLVVGDDESSFLACQSTGALEQDQPEAEWRVSLPPSTTRAVLDLIANLTAPQVDPDVVGLDGTDYALSVRHGATHLSIEWWCNPPRAWSGVTELTRTLLVLAKPPRDLLPWVDLRTVIGVDAATDPTHVGLAAAVVEGPFCTLVDVTCGNEDPVGWINACLGSSSTIIAIDAPLGWPAALGQSLPAHRAGAPLHADPDDLFRRETDRFVQHHLGKRPLDVGADRIARTAHTALKLLDSVREASGLAIPLALKPGFPDRAAAVEVYPAATLTAHGLPHSRYKKIPDIAARERILNGLARKIHFADERHRTRILGSPDALDAVVCILAGLDFLDARVFCPGPGVKVEQEGWIWVRDPNASDDTIA